MAQEVVRHTVMRKNSMSPTTGSSDGFFPPEDLFLSFIFGYLWTEDRGLWGLVPELFQSHLSGSDGSSHGCSPAGNFRKVHEIGFPNGYKMLDCHLFNAVEDATVIWLFPWTHSDLLNATQYYKLIHFSLWATRWETWYWTISEL